MKKEKPYKHTIVYPVATAETVVYRSAITGKFVPKEYAEKHPDTTIKHIVIKTYAR